MKWIYLRQLFHIAENLLTYRDGVISFRDWEEDQELKTGIFAYISCFDKVQLWNRLCCWMTPDTLIAAFTYQCGLGKTGLYVQAGNVSLVDKVLANVVKKGLVEAHIHFNAGFNYESLWINVIEAVIAGNVGADQQEYADVFSAVIFRLLVLRYFKEKQHEQWFFGKWVYTFAEKVQREELLDIVYSMKTGNTDDFKRALNQMPGWKEKEIVPELLFLYECIQYAAESRDEQFTELFLQYIRIKNQFFEKIQQRGGVQGLQYFQKFYNLAAGTKYKMANASRVQADVFRSQMAIKSLKKMEVRIAPAVDLSFVMKNGKGKEGKQYIEHTLKEQLERILCSYRFCIMEYMAGQHQTELWFQYEYKQLQEGKKYRDLFGEFWKKYHDITKENLVPSLGIVYHLLKITDINDFTVYNNMKSAMGDIAEVIENMRTQIPFLGQYIVGLDAASDENAMEPWMFAEVYRRIRNKKITRPVNEWIQRDMSVVYQKVQNIGFTYHVGEDFRHVLSGLRHIDEVIEKFGYKSGDRLGHAIALGIDIEKWTESNGMILLPKMEHLHNLLWIWGKVIDGKWSVPVEIKVLENQIFQVAGEILDGKKYRVKDLYDDYQKLFKIDESVSVYTEEEWKRGMEVTAISISVTEVKTYIALQEYLIEKIAKRGIYVEVNPTSNWLIGSLDDLLEHPVFRFNNIEQQYGDDHHVMLTINSDDPAVFNTNVENELAYIYYAAVKKGYPRETVLAWIDKIRRYGMEGSFIKDVKSTKQILEELSIILDDMRKGK